MVEEHSLEENPIPQQSKKVARGEQQASHKGRYACTTSSEVVWSRSPLSPLPLPSMTT